MPDQETEVEKRTRVVVERLYEAYFAGDSEGMVDTMSDDVRIRFLGRVDFRGKDEARAFFGDNNPKLVDLDFRIQKLIADGPHAAAVWAETARTQAGDPYENHGVDLFTVQGDEIVALRENNDIRIHRRHFGSGG